VSSRDAAFEHAFDGAFHGHLFSVMFMHWMYCVIHVGHVNFVVVKSANVCLFVARFHASMRTILKI
jgi:hypothetical protein